MRMKMLSVVSMVLWAWPIAAQNGLPEAVEVPLRVEDGRLIVTAVNTNGTEYDFVLGLGLTLFTESGSARLGDDVDALTLAGVPVQTEGSMTVPNAYLPGSDAVGVLGGATLNGYDILIDAPNERLILKPIGRAVRWDGVSLSGPTPIRIFHDVLIRAEVDFGGKLVGGLIDLTKPGFDVNTPLGSTISDGTVASFRMGYGSWSDQPAQVVESPVFGGWDPEGLGFAIIGASVAYDCALAISWYHAELRTCLR
jgi:hypothetical protein